MRLRTTDAQKNLDDFLNRYGDEGALVLFFTNLLEEIIRGEFLHTVDSDVFSSPGIRVHESEGHLASGITLKEREGELRRACEHKAAEVVHRLKERGKLEKFDANQFDNPRVRNEVNRALKAVFKQVFGEEWGSEA